VIPSTRRHACQNRATSCPLCTTGRRLKDFRTPSEMNRQAWNCYRDESEVRWKAILLTESRGYISEYHYVILRPASVHRLWRVTQAIHSAVGVHMHAEANVVLSAGLSSLHTGSNNPTRSSQSMPAQQDPSRRGLHAEHQRILCLKMEERHIATDRQIHARAHRNMIYGNACKRGARVTLHIYTSRV
jgi:hypothetical protein